MASTDSSTTVPARLGSLDVYRGFVMFLMAAEVLHLPRIAREFPENAAWQVVAQHTSHVEWVGCSLHDLIQPSFSFMVGVALPYSIAARQARGQGAFRMLGHALWRSLLLVLLGVFLRSVGHGQTNWTFEDTLSQIGLGFPVLFLLARSAPRGTILPLGLILLGYGTAFALYPAPGPAFDWQAVGVPADWPHHLGGFAAHWDKNSNLATAFDQWFLNLFPRESPFVANGGGYATLSFIPTLGTMLLGLMAGAVLRGQLTNSGKFFWLGGAGVICLGLGLALHLAGICPLVKRIWTPTWTLFSGGWCFVILAVLFGVVDWAGWKKWAFPLTVIGMNSIAMYCLVHLCEGFIIDSVHTHLGSSATEYFGAVWSPLVEGIWVLAVLWLILLWMYHRRLFLRI